MNLSPRNLTFLKILDAYIAVLETQPGKALRLPDGEAVFLENGNVYGVPLNASGEIECEDVEIAGCISSVAWDDERCCWEGDDSAEVTVAAVNSPVFIDMPLQPS